MGSRREEIKKRLDDVIEKNKQYLFETEPMTRYEAWWLTTALSALLLVYPDDDVTESSRARSVLRRRGQE